MDCYPPFWFLPLVTLISIHFLYSCHFLATFAGKDFFFLRALARNCNAALDEKKGAEAKDWRAGKPVRVVRNCKGRKHSKYAPEEGNRYDGIYKVSSINKLDNNWKYDHITYWIFLEIKIFTIVYLCLQIGEIQ